MRLCVGLAEAMVTDVCVALRGGNVCVAEKFLHGSQVCTAIQQMRRKTVPQRVRVSWAR